jgi:hypothetical protein
MMSGLSAIAMLDDGIDGVSVGKHASTREVISWIRRQHEATCAEEAWDVTSDTIWSLFKTEKHFKILPSIADEEADFGGGFVMYMYIYIVLV